MKVYIRRIVYLLLTPFMALLLIFIMMSAPLLYPILFILYGKRAEMLSSFLWYDKLYEWYLSLEEE